VKKTSGARDLLVALGVGTLFAAASFLFDSAVQEWMSGHRTPGLLGFMRSVSHWGDWPAHLVLGAIGLVVAWLRGNRQWIAIFAAMMLACAVAGSVNRVIKIAAGRARPSVTADPGWHGPRLSSKYNAFPSGHTASSTAFFAALYIARRRVGIFFLPIPLLIGTARLYVGAHHFSDVICAAFLGVICAVLFTRYVIRRFGLVPEPRC
jgi:membrane-associated phospholipid phosphatase